MFLILKNKIKSQTEEEQNQLLLDLLQCVASLYGHYTLSTLPFGLFYFVLLFCELYRSYRFKCERFYRSLFHFMLT